MAAITLVDISSTVGGGDEQQASAAPQLFNIINVPDPSNDDDGSPSREFMLVTSNNTKASSKYDICEIQTVLPHSGKYASHFVGSRVISNPALHVTTRVDPLYFALAHFQRIMTNNPSAAEQLSKWQPYDQALEGIPLPILRALNLDVNLNINGINEIGQLGHIIEVSDMCGDDLILCKFSDERVLKWLVAKYNKAVVALRKRLLEKKKRDGEKTEELSKMAGGSGAFSSSFNIAEEEPKVEEKKKEDVEGEDTLTKGEEKALQLGALQLICEYIPTVWKNKLSKEIGMAEGDWMGKKKTSSTADSNNEEISAGNKRSRASWEGNIGQEDADALYQYTQGGGGGNSSSIITPADKKDVKNAQSMGLKRLAKVNKKGMKSLTSFFGAGKKKK